MRKVFRLLSLVMVQLVLVVTTSRAELVHVSIGGLTNTDLRDWSGGTQYPIAPTNLDVGGVSFGLVPNGSQSNSLGAVSDTTGNDSFTIAANVAGPTVVYTLMNSAYGQAGSNIATLEFIGTHGAIASFDLIEGTNIRDHYQWTFCNSIAPGTPSAAFGSDRLDRQTFVLPSSFAGETLTQINFTGHGGYPQGQAFVAAITVETAAVPEPTSLVAWTGLGTMGLIGVWRRRNSKRGHS